MYGVDKSSKKHHHHSSQEHNLWAGEVLVTVSFLISYFFPPITFKISFSSWKQNCFVVKPSSQQGIKHHCSLVVKHPVGENCQMFWVIRDTGSGWLKECRNKQWGVPMLCLVNSVPVQLYSRVTDSWKLPSALSPKKAAFNCRNASKISVYKD